MAKYEIDNNKKYSFPDEIKTIYHDGKILIIAPKFANWLVLETNAQLSIFRFLGMGHSINDALCCKKFNESDVNYVVTQLEAKRFCNKMVHSSTIDERSMHLYLTNKCNLFCPHCYMFSGKELESELTTSEILNLLTDYKNIAKGNSITISGGEPTSRADFDTIVKEAASMGLEVNLLTNGTLLNSERIRFLSEYLHSVQISIDGFSEESNSIIRGKGSFEKAMNAVEDFINQGVSTSVAITPPLKVLKENVDKYVRFVVSLANKYSNKNFQVKLAEELIPGRELNLSEKDRNEYFSNIRKIQEGIYGENYETESFVRLLVNDSILDNCMFGCFAVASNGDVYFCARIEDLVAIGNVRTMSMADIYKSSRYAEEATLISNLKPCNECDLRFICGGGCRIEEFPELVKRSSFMNINNSSIFTRSCDTNRKNKFYSLMIKSNPLFYKELISEK